MKIQEDSQLLSVGQVADELQLTDRTIYAWIKSGRIKIVKLGRLIRVPSSELARLQSEGFAAR